MARGSLSRRIGHCVFGVALVAATGRCTTYTSMPEDSWDASALPGADANRPPEQDGSQLPSDAGVVGEAGVPACDVAEAPPPAAIFVAPLLSLDAGTGTGSAQTPFTSVSAAVAALESGAGALILVAEGTYTESVALTKAVDYNLQGAWIYDAGGWRRDCAPGYAARTLLVSKNEVGIRVEHASSLTLRNLSVQSSARSDLPQSSRYGVFAIDTKVRLDGVRVSALDARAGVVGAGGAVGGAPTCQLAPECVAEPAVGATPSRAAGALSSGAFLENGYAPASGKDGIKAGGTGSAGKPGGAGKSDAFCSVGAACTSASCSYEAGTVKAGNGRCGCGGSGGQPGHAGSGGGASVALYVVGGGVEVVDSQIMAGEGGAGAAGGTGGTGAAGVDGVAGSSAKCWSVQCCRCADACFGGHEWQGCCPNPQPTFSTLAGGAAGGTGAKGGGGQTGGGGAGGPSYSVVLLNEARKIDTRSQYAFGAGGAAPAGAAAGPSGLELEVP